MSLPVRLLRHYRDRIADGRCLCCLPGWVPAPVRCAASWLCQRVDDRLWREGWW